MPVGIHKIHPFLAAVFTDRTVKVGVGTWISLIDQPDQIVFHSSFVPVSYTHLVPDSMQKLLGLTFDQTDVGKNYEYIVKETKGLSLIHI